MILPRSVTPQILFKFCDDDVRKTKQQAQCTYRFQKPETKSRFRNFDCPRVYNNSCDIRRTRGCFKTAVRLDQFDRRRLSINKKIIYYCSRIWQVYYNVCTDYILYYICFTRTCICWYTCDVLRMSRWLWVTAFRKQYIIIMQYNKIFVNYYFELLNTCNGNIITIHPRRAICTTSTILPIL